MGITDRKEREKLEMRKLIIDAAMQMFISEGYEKTSIRNIADKIEYSPATIYLYYKDKDELLYEVQGEAFSGLFRLFQEKVTETEPLKKLDQLMHVYLQFGIEHRDLYDLMFVLNSPMKAVEDEVWDNCDDAFGFLVDIVKECIDDLKYDDVMGASLSIWAMAHGIVSLYIRSRFKIMQLPDDEIRQVMSSSLDHYMRIIKQ